MRAAAVVVGLLVALSSCSSEPPRPPDSSSARGESGGTTKSASPSTAAAPTAGSPKGTPSPATATPAGEFDSAAAMGTVRRLAALGPREATSAAYARAAGVVSAQFRRLGYTVAEQRFRVPAGVSWGIDVAAGQTSNVIAQPLGLDPAVPYTLIGAHLDTVPHAPGAEDNASGVAVLLELARLAAEQSTAEQSTAEQSTLGPIVFVAFGAEEPRGPGDDQHHFGSRAYVRRSTSTDAPALTAMVSLDRVGATGPVPVCTGALSPRRVQRELLDVAERVGVPVRACENRTSDHWPFEKAGETVARVGGNDSAGYHSAGDLPRTVSRRQLGRAGTVLWEWLR